MKDDYRSIEDSRHVSYDFFHLRKPVILYFETDEKTVKIMGYTEQNDPGIFSNQEETTITVVCPDPWFYDLAPTTLVFSGIEPMFEFPFSNESLTKKLIIFGEIKDNIIETFCYKGDVEVGFEAEVYLWGPIQRLRIMNIDKREVLEIDTRAVDEIAKGELGYGDTIFVSTVPGNKYCILRRYGEDINILNAVKKDSVWPMIYPGENTFGYISEIGTENLWFKITYETAYEGL